MGEVLRAGKDYFGAARRLRAALLTSSALALAWTLPATPSHAQDATWLASPGSNGYVFGSNWSIGTVPSGTAFFGASNTTGLSIPANDETNTTNVGGWTFNAGAGNYTFANGQSLNFNGAGVAINGGSATITVVDQGGINFLNASTAGGATIVNNNVSGAVNFYNTSTAGTATITTYGDVNFYNSSTAGSANITVNYNGDDGGRLLFNDTSSAGSATVTNNMLVYFKNTSTAGSAAITNNGGVNFSGASTAGNATITNIFHGTTSFQNTATAGTAQLVNSGTSTFFDFSGSSGPNGDHKLSAGSIGGNGTFYLGANALTVGGNNLSTAVTGVIADGGTSGGTGASLVKIGTGTMTLSGVNTYTGGTTVNGGTLQAGAANVFSPTSQMALNAGGTLDLGDFAQTIKTVSLAGGTLQNGSLTGAVNSSGGTINALGGSLSLTTTSGTTLVTGINSFTGGTTVNGGVLDVIGTLSDPTVNSGGTLIGTGSVGATQVNAGGTFAPGNGTPGTSMTVTGNLAFQSGAIYLVQVNPSAASFATVTGSATLGSATVNAVFAGGSYVSKQYTILTANGSISGTFGSLVTTNLPANFHTTLSYDANDAYLNLALNFTPSIAPNFGGGLSGNQQVVGNALTHFFNTTGRIPLVFGTLTGAGLTQASGEIATGSQAATFQAMGQFMGLLTDPFGAGRDTGGSAAPSRPRCRTSSRPMAASTPPLPGALQTA